jgi:opacity protein-like surface antigen
MALLVAAMMALPANAAMWVGGEIGANFIANTNLSASGGGTLMGLNSVNGVPTNPLPPALRYPVGYSLKYQNMGFNPAVLGGLTVGYDFVNAGFAGYDWPSWMQYFGVIADFTYNRVAIPNQRLPVSGTVAVPGANLTPFLFPTGVSNLFAPGGGTSNGDVCALAFLVYGHYGFFPDSAIAIGRVHPYLGVGPGIAWTHVDLSPYGLAGQTSVNVALAVEGGLRFILLPNVTTDIGFRYRYLCPSWNRSGNMTVASGPNAYLPIPGVNSIYPGHLLLSPAALKASVDSVNSLTFLLRVNYHF